MLHSRVRQPVDDKNRWHHWTEISMIFRRLVSYFVSNNIRFNKLVYETYQQESQREEEYHTNNKKKEG